MIKTIFMIMINKMIIMKNKMMIIKNKIIIMIRKMIKIMIIIIITNQIWKSNKEFA